MTRLANNLVEAGLEGIVWLERGSGTSAGGGVKDYQTNQTP